LLTPLPLPPARTQYGKRDGQVATEVELTDLRTLTVRVINEPGHRHGRLLRVQAEAGGTSFVFAKGVQLHTIAKRMNPSGPLNTSESTSSAISNGDGGWIMMRCVLFCFFSVC
jgi:hypothetical protein